MVSIMDAVDDLVFGDSSGFLSHVSTEKLVRRAYGLEKAFEDVHRESDWRRPGGKKPWSSKVRWDLCSKYDLRVRVVKASSALGVEKVVAKDAAFYKYFDKARAHGPKAE